MSVVPGCDVSVIIVNYNTEALLADCLESVYEHTQGVDFEVIVVDNASVDGSRDLVRNSYPAVRLLENAENAGFGRANNRGAALARGRYVLFLNSDTRLLNDALKAFFDYCEAADGTLGVVGCWLRGADGGFVNSYGVYPSYGSSIANRLELALGIPAKPAGARQAGSACRVACVTGADMFMRTDLFLEAGGFDEDFFMYYEETELQRRLSRAGYRHELIPAPQIVHLEEGSKKSRMRSRVMMERSMYRYFYKTRGLSPAYLAFIFANSVLSLVSNLRYPWRDWLVYFHGLGLSPRPNSRRA